MNKKIFLNKNYNKPRLEVIPMIDIMMFLLVFFVILSLRMIEGSGIPMEFPSSIYPETIEIGHHDAHHKIVKGIWKVTKTYLEEQGRTSLNHGGKEKFSYLISHVNVEHGFIDSLQKIIFPLLAIVILSLLINHFYIAGNYDRWSWRVGGQLTLFLTIPALKFALSGELPSTHYLNLTDSLFIWATIVVTYNMTLGILSHYKSIEEGSTEIQTIDKFARISSPLVAIGVIAAFSYTII